MADDFSLKNANCGMRLNVELGNQLDFKLEDMNQSFRGILVGLEPQEYLIIKTTMPGEFKNRLSKGGQLEVRYMSLGSEYGFKSRLIDMIEKPFRLIFLSYPDVVENFDSREGARVSCYIPSTATMDGKKTKGTVTDISTNGCRFVIKLPVNLQPRQLMLVDKIQLQFPIFGLKGIQEFNGIVKNTTIDKEKIAMGIEFFNLDSKIVQSMADYISSVVEIST